VAIIGAGFGGLATAVKLQERTNASFVVFEKSAGVGGTWWDNRYPGCEVDVHSRAYSFSFVRYSWPRTHATQPELQAYAEHVVDHFGLRPRIRLNTRVVGVDWDELAAGYRVTTADGQTDPFDLVVAAPGLLSIPKHPDWPGLESFAGQAFHTTEWPDDLDTKAKRVAVVGTGSTAAQLVPAIAEDCGSLLVFQREPGWIGPKGEHEYTAAERRRWDRHPLIGRLHRAYLFYGSMRRFKAFDADSKQNRQVRTAWENYVKQEVDDPTLQGLVTPSYDWGCKRPILASTFYKALNRDNVQMIPRAVERVTATGIVDAAGVEHPVDVLVMSTGFQPTRFLATMDVVGVGGQNIRDAWGPRPSAFLGITVPGFPNFFILYGPNTNGGFSIIAQLERQAEVVVASVRRLERARPGSYIDTSPAAHSRWVRWIDRRIASTSSAMEASCSNYYHSESGANVTQWPGAHTSYWATTRLLHRWGLRRHGPAEAA
jgi:cyclohexanone monooxygenase